MPRRSFTWKAVNPRTWIESTDYAALRFQPSLRAFAEQRAEQLAALHATAPKGWSRIPDFDDMILASKQVS